MRERGFQETDILFQVHGERGSKALVQFSHDHISRELENLDKDDDEKNRESHHVRLIAIVTVTNREVPDPSPTDESSHGRIGKETDGHDRDSVGETGTALRIKDL